MKRHRQSDEPADSFAFVFCADVTTDLFINALLPPTRKLISLPLRGADWKALRKNQQIDEATKDKIYALWHFEATLKEQYFGELTLKAPNLLE